MDNSNIYLLGKLDSNVFTNVRDVVQFSIKSILKDNKGIIDSNKFTCFIDSIYKYGLIEYEEESSHDKFYDFLKDRLVIFKSTMNNINPATCDEIFVKKPEHFNDELTYKAIPVFSKKNLKISFEEFKRKLIAREWIESIKGISENIDDIPNIILFEDEEKIYALTGFKKQFHQYGKVRYDYSEIYSVEENEIWYENFVRSPELENIIFVEENTALEIENLARLNNPFGELADNNVMKEEKDLGKSLNNTEKTMNEISEEDAGKVEEDTIGASFGELLKTITFDETAKEEVMKSKVEVIIEDETEESNVLSSNIDESSFLKGFINTCKAMNLLYEEKDLINFHIAMKSSKLVILSGMSGTGKSKIVQAYSKALGIDENRLNFISVRSSWGDDSDLLGYVDSINHIYRPGDSGFIDTLVEASNNKDELYIICLDEMNLARVEHYFSQILSVLELDKKDRILRLYNEELEDSINNSDRYKANIKIGDNILLVGTVNLDESTYHFSDKVLDRANVITLNQVSFLELKKLRSSDLKLDFIKEVSFREYSKMVNNDDILDLTERELELLSEIHEKMNFLNKNVGIGFRIITQIDDYIRNIPEESVISRSEGIDIQLSQRILPKIRGTKEQWGAFIGEYDIYDDESLYSSDLNSELIKILDSYSDVSDFKTSKKYILNKARELSIYGYTL